MNVRRLGLSLLLATLGTPVLRQTLRGSSLGSDRSPLVYQQRGERCEGIYKLEVNSEPAAPGLDRGIVRGLRLLA